MTSVVNKLKYLVLIASMVLVSACSRPNEYHGYFPPQEVLDEIRIGVDTRQTLSETVGSPSTAGLLDGGDWFYIRSTYQQRAVLGPLEIDRQVLAIRFNARDVVENVELFGLEDGQVVALSRRVTESPVRGMSFLKQLFGNIGGISTDQIFGQ